VPAFSFSLNDLAIVWLSLLYEALPFVALGAIISGLVETFVSRESVVRWLPRRRLAGIGISAVLGIAFPMCECGIVPVVRRLVRKGVPASCAVTYMLSAPIVHPLVIVGTAIAFRGQGATGMVLLRLGLGLLVSIAIGLLAWQVLGDDGMFREALDPPQESGSRRPHSARAGPAPASSEAGSPADSLCLSPSTSRGAPHALEGAAVRQAHGPERSRRAPAEPLGQRFPATRNAPKVTKSSAAIRRESRNRCPSGSAGALRLRSGP